MAPKRFNRLSSSEVEDPSMSKTSPPNDQVESQTFRRGHKGKGSNQRRQEAFRYRKNVETVTNFRDAIRQRFSLPADSPFNSLPSQARQFIEPRVPSTVQKPIRTIPIRTDGVRKLFPSIRSALINMKIEVTDDEYRALIYITARQISAKIFFSQVGFGSLNSVQYVQFQLHRETAAMMCEALRPFAIFIECLGRFFYNGQTNIPVLEHYNSSDVSEIGCAAHQHIVENYDLFQSQSILDQLYHLQHDADPLLFNHLGRYTFSTIDPNQMTMHYKSLMSKVLRRNSDAVVMLDIEKGIGSTVQLIGSKVEGNEIRCGSLYPFDVHDLVIGGLFGFGRATVHDEYPSPMHNLEYACVQCDVPHIGWNTEYAMGLFKT